MYFLAERQAIINAAKRLYELGIMTGLEGNYSIKLEENKLLISPKGIKLHDLNEHDLIICDYEGNIIEGKHQPSSGLTMHRIIYENRPEINTVFHTHSIAATSFAIANQPIPNSLEVLNDFAGGEIPVAAPYAPLGSDDLANNIKLAMNNSYAVLLKNHGVLCFGKDVDHAVNVSWSVEMAARMVINANTLGTVTKIEGN
ncbi:class II aldolase/adducin family protein [Virgibacillus kimchii]